MSEIHSRCRKSQLSVGNCNFHRFSAGLDGIQMELTTEYRLTTGVTPQAHKTKWIDDFLKYLLAGSILTVFSMLVYCVWKIIQHRWRIRSARKAQKKYADSGYGTTRGEDLPPPPPELDRDSMNSERYSSCVTEPEQQVPEVVVTTTATATATASTSSSSSSSSRPVTSPSAAPTPAAGMAASLFRRCAQVAGYAPGVPLDPSATGVCITHQQPVPQAADYTNPDKRLRSKKKKKDTPPATAPKPRSPSRGRGVTRESPRLATLRRSVRQRKKAKS